MELKVCRQCGELKPINQYRKYYNNRHGTYTICRSCERINSRFKYLANKGAGHLSPDEAVEFGKLEDLYAALRAAGLQPPRSASGRRTPVAEDIDQMIAKYSARAVPESTAAVPIELSEWLDASLDKDPDYYLDEIYEALREKYRPVVCIDAKTLMPVYDDTYKQVLDKILTRFNAYEDEYYER